MQCNWASTTMVSSSFNPQSHLAGISQRIRQTAQCARTRGGCRGKFTGKRNQNDNMPTGKTPCPPIRCSCVQKLCNVIGQAQTDAEQSTVSSSFNPRSHRAEISLSYLLSKGLNKKSPSQFFSGARLKQKKCKIGDRIQCPIFHFFGRISLRF